jgi:hypothetical protein
VFGVEVFLFTLSMLYNTTLYMVVHLFPSSSSWLDLCFFLMFVVAWILIATMLRYRNSALRNIPTGIVITTALSIVYFIYTAFFGAASLRLSMRMFGAPGVLLNIGPIALGIHLLLRARLNNRIKVSPDPAQ